jgi:hypothetical protein
LFLLWTLASLLILYAFFGATSPTQMVGLWAVLGAFTIVGALFAASFTPYLLWVHHRISQTFDRAVDVTQARGREILGQLLVCCCINLAFYTILSIVPFHVWIESVPFGKLIEAVFPSGQLAEGTVSTLKILLLATFGGVGGPAAVFGTRYLRLDGKLAVGPRAGGRVLRLLQALCYLSWIALIFYAPTLPMNQLFDFTRNYVMFVFASTLLSLGSFRELERQHAKSKSGSSDR